MDAMLSKVSTSVWFMYPYTIYVSAEIQYADETKIGSSFIPQNCVHARSP